MIRIAAVGDVHFDSQSAGRLCAHFKRLHENADIFLLAGDLTQIGSIEEMKALAQDLKQCMIPTIAVLGNHDYHSNQVNELTQILENVGVTVLENQSVELEINGYIIGVAGAKGFGGGFVGASGSEFGEPEMKAFMLHSKNQALRYEEALKSLQVDLKLGLLHYSPTAQTLMGEKKQIYPFLGSYYLAQALDRAGADLVFHGHAHKGVEKGLTPGGIPVRNVAQPVIRHAFNVYHVDVKKSIKDKNEMLF